MIHSSKPGPRPPSILCRAPLAAALLLAFAVAAAGDPPPTTPAPSTPAPSTPAPAAGQVGPREVLRFEQSRLAAQMGELEERMYRLSESLRDLEPENSSRLLAALKYAREELLLLRMRETEEQLQKPDLAVAIGSQKQTLARLLRLHELLASPDLDFQLKLEQLRLIRRLQKQAAAAAAEQQPSPDAENADARERERLRQEQAELRARTRALSEQLARLGRAGQRAQAEALRAEEQQQKAEEALERRLLTLARRAQGEAQASLAAAASDLDDEAQELLEELQPELRVRVLDALRQMHALQQTVRKGLDAASPMAASATAASERASQAALVQLGRTEDRLLHHTDELLDLLDETGFSIALPPALRVLRPEMSLVRDRLAAGQADAPLPALAARLEADLLALVEAMRRMPTPPTRAQGQAQRGEPRQRERELNRLVSELRMLRLLQERVEQRTADLDRQRTASAGPPADDLKRRIADVETEQELLRETAARLSRERLGGEVQP